MFLILIIQERKMYLWIPMLILLDDDDNDSHIEEDEELAKALEESLNVDISPPQNDYGNVIPPLSYSYSGGYRYMENSSCY